MGTLCAIDSGSSNAQDAVDDAPYVLFDRSKKIKRSTRYLFDCEALIIPGEGTEFLPRHFVGKFDLHQRAYALHNFSERIDVKYLYYYLIYLKDYFPRVAVGATVKSLRRRHFENLPVTVAPQEEQQRIVAILDEAFAGLATVTANAEKNLKNARGLFESQLDLVFAEGGKGWVERRLGDLFDIGSSKRIRETEWTSAGVPFYGGKEIVRLAKFGAAASDAYISEEKYRDYASKYDMPRKGDILITARGTIGVGYVVKEGDKFYYKDGNIISFREKAPTNPFFILYAFRSTLLVQQFADLTGATVTHLPIERAKSLVLKIPDIGSQNAVVERLGTVEREAQRLANVYEQKLVALNALKQSILQKAFSSELTSPPSQAIKEAAE